MDFITLTMAEDETTINIAVNDQRKPLIEFPSIEVAKEAVAWCTKKKLDSCGAANAMIDLCKKKGVKQTGRGLPKAFGEFAGVKCYQVKLGDLTPNRKKD